MQAKSIDEVVTILDNIILQTRDSKSKLGYFAALYRKVRIKIRDGIDNGFFDDGSRMKVLDVNFANRYFAAYDKQKNNDKPTESWHVAFKASHNWWSIVLQHLLLGMNAHINLDLGIAAVRTVGKNGLDSLHDDFNKINEILFSLIDDVEDKLSQIWPALTLLDRVAGKTDETIIRFSMKKAWNYAWKLASDLGNMEDNEQKQDKLIKLRDMEIAKLSGVILHPGITTSLITKYVRLNERGSIPQIIDILS